MSTPPECDERALIEGLISGDRGAYREAVRRFSPRLLATARSIAGPDQAEDVVQEVWLRVVEKIREFEGRATLLTWLQRITVNAAISQLRRQRREVSAPDTGGDPDHSDWFDERGHWLPEVMAGDLSSPEALLSAAALQDCIDKHLALLPPNQRSAVVLRDTEEYSLEEICNELQLSASNVRVQLHRGRMKLMQMILTFERTGTC
ncbi:MAG: sigma-70 family RNA polymerase sigma factor [Pseudomonadales bacterium]